ncbi:DUF1801 domain-containing protein [Streptomyces sp. CB01580]|uniref:DUF1801 domain-containing protein n=1 Tax=Streptomyces sp. CB01580 TaxID=1703933 RepID=UPI00093C6FC9|nr:DUF1801 domain-containing protein [Streptomyces sp. CB01580]OKJ40094.1 hypothetical protein AMK22_11235 [Streptomyces sp. CB01580]
MGKFAPVEEYVAGLATGPFRDIVEKLIPLIDAALPDANSAVYHQAPTWSAGEAPGKGPVCYVRAYSKYVTFGFWRGQELDDPSGRLQPGARIMGQAKLASVDEIDEKLFADWLKQAGELEAAELAKA